MARQAERIQKSIGLLTNRMWIGSILQSMRIVSMKGIPTAGVMYDPKLKTLNLAYSDEFISELDDLEVVGLMMHEILHITESHVYMYRNSSKSDLKRLNFAMDLAINQKITTTNIMKNAAGGGELYPELPKGTLRIEHFKDKNGVQFPPGLSVEQYYDLLENFTYENPEGGNGEPQEFDQHDWDNIDKKEMAEAVAELLKRAQNEHEKKFGSKSQEIADYLDQCSKVIKGVNFKEILLNSLRQLTPGNDIKKTWSKPSRRYGNNAKGKLFKPSPTVHIFGDTSGSITVDELNDMLQMMNSFLNSGAKKVDLSLFHSSLYYTKAYKKNDKFRSEDLQSGGTDLSDCFKYIEEHDVDLAVFITDGYYSMPYMPKKLNAKCFFIIKQGSNVEHCLKPYGKTIVYESQLKNA